MFRNKTEDREILGIVKNFKAKKSTDTYNIDMTIVKTSYYKLLNHSLIYLINLLKMVNFQI